jgi:C_GCAxxG_C_C family probable redox protein
LSERIEQAVELYRQGHNCAQALLVAFGESCGLDRDTSQKLALGLGGGLGKTGEICGAANGACILLGQDTGEQEDPFGKQAQKKAQKRVREFLRAFKKECGAVTCRDLVGSDIATRLGMAEAVGKRAFVRNCPQYVEIAARILDGMLGSGNGDGQGPDQKS